MRAEFGLTVPMLAIMASSSALESPDGTGRLPAMGWNSWNEYACNITEDVFLRVSDLLIEHGLKDLGYKYVNIDDCWSNKELRRDNVTGRIIPDYVKFPGGIKGLAEKVHAKGLKLGIYGDAGMFDHQRKETASTHLTASSLGTLTCGGFAGSLGFEDIDAATWAEWGIDCLSPSSLFDGHTS
jgi:alpha-galactosidase